MTKTTALFDGLGDMTCTVMQFINEVSNGEQKGEEDKGASWIGSGNIMNLFDKIKDKVYQIKEDKALELSNNYADYVQSKTNIELFKNGSDPLYPESLRNVNDYKITIGDIAGLSTLPATDTALTPKTYNTFYSYMYGPRNEANTYLNSLDQIYAQAVDGGDEGLRIANENFNSVFDENLGTTLDEAKESVSSIQTSIDDVTSGHEHTSCQARYISGE